MLSRLIAEQALAAALRTGGDFAEIFYEDTRSSSLTLNAGAIETALTGRTAGAGVRVYKGSPASMYTPTTPRFPALCARRRRRRTPSVPPTARWTCI